MFTLVIHMANKPKRKQEQTRSSTSSSSEDVLNTYIREISRFPLLKAEEEIHLARQVVDGSEDARNQLVISNLRLVVKIAHEYSDSDLPLIDLIQEGNIGLMQAVDRFDPEKGYRLTTYAVWWIRRSMLSAITQQSRMIRIPDYLFRAQRRLKQLRCLSQYSQAHVASELTEVLGVSVDKLQQIEAQIGDMRSLDELVSDESDEVLEEQLQDTHVPPPEKEALRLLFREELADVLEHIPARQAFALRLHYGIEDGQPYNLAEVGRIMNVSRERARQLVNKGHKRLTEHWGTKSLDHFRSLLQD